MSNKWISEEDEIAKAEDDVTVPVVVPPEVLATLSPGYACLEVRQRSGTLWEARMRRMPPDGRDQCYGPSPQAALDALAHRLGGGT